MRSRFSHIVKVMIILVSWALFVFCVTGFVHISNCFLFIFKDNLFYF